MFKNKKCGIYPDVV